MNNNQTSPSHNLNLCSIIKPKGRALKISLIPIDFRKKKFNQKLINFTKNNSFNKNKIFFDYSLNKNNHSNSKDKKIDKFSNEIVKSNDLILLKKNIEIIKNEIDNINKMLKDNKYNSENLIKNLKDLNIMKENRQKMLENNLSKKESLEEMSNTIINNIKKGNFSNINENNFIEISIEEIKNNNKNSYIKNVFNVFNYINNYNDKKYFNFISKTIEQAYFDFFSHLNNNKIYNVNNLIKKFFFDITVKISSQIICKCPEKIINILLYFLLKINIISENIEKIIHYLDKEYKEQKNEINQKINDIEKKNSVLQLKIIELKNLKNKINEKIDIFSKKKSPFFERTIHKKRLKRKKMRINNDISSLIHLSKEYYNKSINSCIENNNSNNFENKENNDDKNLKKINGNMLKFLNKSKIDKCPTYNSNQISIGKIIMNGISVNYSSEKNDKNLKKITLENKINKIRKIELSCKKESDNILIKRKKLQNGKKNYIRERNNNSQMIINNLTEINHIIQKNNLKNKNNKENDNLKCAFIRNQNITKNYVLLDNNSNKKEKVIKNNNNSQNNINIKKTNKYLLNGKLQFINKHKKYNFSKIYSFPDNIYSEKKKMPFNLSNGNRILSRYLSNYKSFNSGNNDLHFKKTYKNPKNLISKIKNETKMLKDEIRNKIKNKNSCDAFDRIDISLSNIQNSFSNNRMESFCYYKLLEKDSKLFNPLKSNINLNKLGYNEGFISINEVSNSLKISSKYLASNSKNINLNYINNIEYSLISTNSENNSTKNKCNSINIEFKEIINVYLNNLMKNIIKIHKIFLEYNIDNKNGSSDNSENGISKKKFSGINELINIKEIMNIKEMNQSEKIKAGLCNFFSFIIELENSNRIEFILINFFQFNNLYNYLVDIVKTNIKFKKPISNGSNSSYCKIKNNGVFKLKEFYNKIKNKQKGQNQRIITEKNDLRFYKIKDY